MAVSVDIEKKLHGFTLRVKVESHGSPMGILGASGSGKSMTLRCIAGIQTPDSGRIVVNDKVLFDSEKKINLKPQEENDRFCLLLQVEELSVGYCRTTVWVI